MKYAVGVVIAVVVSAMSAYGHGGGLDKNGCHTNRKTGDYHCHGSGLAAPASPSPVARSQPAAAVPAGSGSIQMGWSGKVSATDEELVKTAQHLLRTVGYQVSVTGTQDTPTVQAIGAFQDSQRMAKTGRVSGTLLLKLAETAANRKS